MAAAIVSSALFNFGFLPPYGTFDLERPEYLGAFLGFLAMSLLISWLVGVARERATAAEDREAEVRLLFDLSHVLVSERAEGLVPGARPCRRAAGVRHGLGPRRRSRRDRRASTSRCGSARHRSGRWSSSGTGRRSRRRRHAWCAPSPTRSRWWSSGERLAAELREAEVYRRAEDMRRSLLAAASHELKSPVAAITASVTDVLGRDRLDPEVVREVLEDVRASTSRLEQLITNLLDMSRIESGTLVAATRDRVPRRPARTRRWTGFAAAGRASTSTSTSRRTRAACVATRCSSNGSSRTSSRTPPEPCAAPPIDGSSFEGAARGATWWCCG